MPQYDWKSESIPELKNHSKCKHDILHEYLLRYIHVLHTGTLRYGNEQFNLTIVDGCAGGGKFQYDNQIVDGSPFVILNTIREVITTIQIEREENGHAAINMNIDVLLVEKDEKTAKFLEEQLQNEGRFTEDVQVMQGDFNKKLPEIINFIKKKSKGKPGRCLFFLDQYGYTQIELCGVREILRSLKSEVILTFAIDYLIDYLSSSRIKPLVKIRFSQNQIDQLIRLAKNTKGNRYIIEHILTQHITSVTGAKFYTPFFIRGDDTHRGYWLVHLSSHYRARDEMLNIHWKIGNNLQHFGSAGIDMLGYRSDNDESYTKQLFLNEEFRFDHDAAEKVRNSLIEEIPKLIYQRGSIQHSDLLNKIFNHTPANREMISEVLWEGVESKEFSIRRRNAKNIKDGDVITASRQMVIRISRNR